MKTGKGKSRDFPFPVFLVMIDGIPVNKAIPQHLPTDTLCLLETRLQKCKP